jgi:hypothetical protein
MRTLTALEEYDVSDIGVVTDMYLNDEHSRVAWDEG